MQREREKITRFTCLFEQTLKSLAGKLKTEIKKDKIFMLSFSKRSAQEQKPPISHLIFNA